VPNTFPTRRKSPSPSLRSQTKKESQFQARLKEEFAQTEENKKRKLKPLLKVRL